MSTMVLSENYYDEWCAYRNESSDRMPVWAKEEKIFNCEGNGNGLRAKGRKLLRFLKNRH